MNIVIRMPLKSDYLTVNRMLLKLQNYHSENLSTIYKKMDNFFSVDEYLKILEDKNTFFLLAILNKEIVGLIWLRVNEKSNKYEYERK